MEGDDEEAGKMIAQIWQDVEEIESLSDLEFAGSSGRGEVIEEPVKRSLRRQSRHEEVRRLT